MTMNNSLDQLIVARASRLVYMDNGVFFIRVTQCTALTQWADLLGFPAIFFFRFPLLLSLPYHTTFNFYTMTVEDDFEAEVERGRVLTMPKDGTGLAVLDPWLEPFRDDLRARSIHICNLYTLVRFRVLTDTTDTQGSKIINPRSLMPVASITLQVVTSSLVSSCCQTIQLFIVNGHQML